MKANSSTSIRMAGWQVIVIVAISLFLATSIPQTALAQAANGPLNIFKNYFVTGDYIVAGWTEKSPDGSGFAPGTISIPDTRQPAQNGVATTVPKGADIVAAYLYWATVEKSKSAFAGQQGFFNGYAITGTVLGNPNAPVSWSSGGCAGASNGTTTMRTYRADVRPYLPLDTNPNSPTFGAFQASGSIPVRLADSGSNGNTAPKALGASLVVIYRVLNPPAPLNAIVLYDGAYAPGNAAQTASQTISGFYQASIGPVAKLTHIVANGQPNKSEQVFLNTTSQPLPSLYGSLPPFPGIYGSWDNPTWNLSEFAGYVKPNDAMETTSVVPSASNRGCVSWGAMILSTTVQDSDGDGLLDVWELNQGYTDAVSGQWVALPGASVNTPDLFVEVDYLSNLDGLAGPYLHSHLPKEAALDTVGEAFAAQHINIHFDVGPSTYQGDPYVIPAGTGGNAISEGLLLCTDGVALCPFPGQPAIAWKGDFEFAQNNSALGNFQPGRAQSYHYVLFGHSLGVPKSFWSTFANELSDSAIPQLVSVTNSGNTATVTIQSPAGVLKPGDCPNALNSACSAGNSNRVTIAGAIAQPNLNGTYAFSSPTSVINAGTTTTTFTITTANVANGTYNFANEPQLGVSYLGPTSTSGHSDFGGGADSAVTLGLWATDDPAGCQADPSVPAPVYCNNQTGSVNVQAGTLLHELGHTLALTHGGTYYNDANNPSLPTYEVNCKPNFLSVMNYLFQVRGFVDGGLDYSGQTLPQLNEAYPALSESSGIGVDMFTGQPSTHITRWYSAPNALDVQLQNSGGGRYATAHCDGTPLTANDVPAVRVDGSLAPGGTFSAPLDWNNDSIVPDSVAAPGVDLNYNGLVGDSPFSGFNDWQALNFQQMSARASSFGFSEGGGLKAGGGGIKAGGGGIDGDGGGIKAGGGGLKAGGGGTDQDEDTANSTVNPPTSLTCTTCVNSLEVGKSVPLTWNPPGYGQIRSYYIWRAAGSFPTLQGVLANLSKFSMIKTLTGTPPSPSYTDTSVKDGATYTYFVTDQNKQTAQSGPSNPPVVVTVKSCGTLVDQTFSSDLLSPEDASR